MLNIREKAVLYDKPVTLRSLYDRHAGMLLGFISQVVNDRKLAEEFLTRMFCDLSQHFDGDEWNSTNSWCKLQRLARGKLASSNETDPGLAVDSRVEATDHLRNFAGRLNEEQAKVFCKVYYNGKTTASIAKELNKSEELIRKSLKEAFAIIRQGG